MQRRIILQAGCGFLFGSQLWADMNTDKIETALDAMQQSVDRDLIDAAVVLVRQGDSVLTRAFGQAKDDDAIFLLASISKPIAIAAVMSLYDLGQFDLEDRASKFLPEFIGDGREQITIRQLMTHVCGLPDQLPQNSELRSRHADLPEFVEAAMRTPLLFEPGSKYSYSSMGILLASEIARRISGKPIAELTDEVVYRPLQMSRSALGVGNLDINSLMRCQVEKAAPESGAGDPSTRSWDWNSEYWRRLGSPWGGAHGSAGDVARFLDAFLNPEGRLLKPETTALMIANQNRSGIRPRGLGFDLGKSLGGSHTSDQTFGHGGATGTVCWADPETNTICVVLTTLPSEAVPKHPRDVVSQQVAQAVKAGTER